jgi:hypothetical protein
LEVLEKFVGRGNWVGAARFWRLMWIAANDDVEAGGYSETLKADYEPSRPTSMCAFYQVFVSASLGDCNSLCRTKVNATNNKSS